MRPNKLREKLNAGEPTLATHIHTTWPSIVEALGHTGAYDYVEFVAEYGPFDLHDLDNLARAAELWDLGTMIKVDAEKPRLCGPTGHRVGLRQCALCRCARPGRRTGLCALRARRRARGRRHLWGSHAAFRLYELWRHPRIRPSFARRGRGFDD